MGTILIQLIGRRSDYKKTIPFLPPNLVAILIGCMLGDACMYRVSKDSKVKFEQGYMHADYLFFLFNLFKEYSFQDEPYARKENKGPREGLIKSFSFRTFTHPTFNLIWDLFMSTGKKTVQPGLILNHLTDESLAYWIMDDGSLQIDKKSLIIHTQSYSHEEVQMLSLELNQKFNLHTKVIAHKNIYRVIFIPRSDAVILYNLINSYMHPSMSYKLPKI